MKSQQGLARIAGALYLIVAVCGGFSQFFVRGRLVVAGDAAATAAHIRQHADLFRAGLVSDLVNVGCFLAVALVLYALLSPVSRWLAMSALVCNAVSVAVMAVNVLNHYAALVAATRGPDERLAGFYMDVFAQGYLVGQIFFGLWLLPLGLVIYRSGLMPRALGVLVMLGCVGYLGDLLRTPASPVLLVLPVVGEVALVLWLLAGRIRTTDPAPALTT
ncbi:DUF4386 domain-containing protein [Dactylosporangium sp. CA-233914]|uniref:DUF4386 domain-containing protein n=1 Tax=Dactylosporangium sp. CA-233914 TaxID=3239934 RepID=UPI003D8CCE5D